MKRHPAGGGIYAITHIDTGRCYVGQTISFRKRWNSHRTKLNGGVHGNLHLQRSWSKHGESAFEFGVLELVSDAALLDEREQAWIDSLRAYAEGFNINPLATSCRGVKRRPETIAKLKAAAQARGISPELREKMAAAARGRKLSPDHIAKVSAALTGRRCSEETRARISASNQGKKRPQSGIDKVAAALRGRKHTPEHKANISSGLVGHSVSEETRAKIAAANIGREVPIERREKISAALLGHTQPPAQIEKRQVTMTSRSPEEIALWKARISAAGKGRKMSAESIAKRQASRYGEKQN